MKLASSVVLNHHPLTFSLLIKACKYGHLEVMDVIYELASTVKLTEEMLTADNHFAFKMATENHQKSAATLLKAWEVPAKVTETSETNPDASSLQVSKWKNDEEFLSLFKKTVHNDYHVSELLALCKNVDEALKTSAISLEDYWCFANSAECDRVDMLQTLFNLCSSEKLKREMITSKNYKAFVLAAENGNLKSVKAIYEMCSPQDKTDILTSENCRAFILAARRGHIDILEVMLQWASKAQQSTTLFKANRCEAFWISCKMGLVQVVHLLYQKAPTADFREKMMAIDKYLPLRLAIEAKQTSVMTLLISWYTNKDVVCEFLKIHLKSSAEMNEEIKGLYASVLEIIVPPVAKPVLKQDQEKKPVFSEKEFFDAIIANDIAQVRKMAAWATDQDKDKAITGDGFWCLRHAATEGLLDVLEFLYSWMGGNSQLQSKALESSDYACFRLAVSRNRSDVVALLLSWASSAQVSGMIESSQFSTFIDAAQHGYLDIMCLLRERASLNQRKKQIEQGKFAALKLSVKGNQSNSVALLISWIPETSKSWLSTEWKHFFDSVSSKDRSLPTFDLVDIFLNSSVVVKSEQMAAANGKPTILPATIASDFSAATLGKTAAQKSYGDDEIFSLMKDKVINNLLLDAQELYDAASTSQKRKIIENEEHYLFAYCADKGRLEMVSRIFGWGNQTQQIAMLSTRQYYPFKNACKNGHLPTVRKLHDLAEEVLHDNQRMGMFSINNYEPFFSAASNNSLHVMNQLYEWGSDSQKKAMIEAEDYKCARLALENGHHLALILLFSLSGNKSKDLIKAIGSHIESVPEKKRPAVQNTLDGIVAMILNIGNRKKMD